MKEAIAEVIIVIKAFSNRSCFNFMGSELSRGNHQLKIRNVIQGMKLRLSVVAMLLYVVLISACTPGGEDPQNVMVEGSIAKQTGYDLFKRIDACVNSLRKVGYETLVRDKGLTPECGKRVENLESLECRLERLLSS